MSNRYQPVAVSSAPSWHSFPVFLPFSSRFNFQSCAFCLSPAAAANMTNFPTKQRCPGALPPPPGLRGGLFEDGLPVEAQLFQTLPHICQRRVRSLLAPRTAQLHKDPADAVHKSQEVHTLPQPPANTAAPRRGSWTTHLFPGTLASSLWMQNFTCSSCRNSRASTASASTVPETNSGTDPLVAGLPHPLTRMT